MIEESNSMTEQVMLDVEVCYALPDKQQIIALQLPQNATVFEAAVQSGIVAQFPEVELESAKMGVFGKVVAKPKEQVLSNGDRVEIYRPLIADPKEVRKERAARIKAEKAK